jgi:hypothetical protein
MSDQASNPLSKYFRHPQIYLKLPGAGRHWPHDSLELPGTGELPVLAMTAKDELVVKTPDALLNGQATVDVIQSCCPSIKDAWATPLTDLDAILIAIRIATYGNEMDFVTVCPHCGSKNEHVADLGYLSSLIKCPDFDETIKVDGMEIFLKPITFKDFNESNMKTYEEQRIIAVVQNESMPEAEKIMRFHQLFKSVLDMTVRQVSSNVAAIKLDDGTVVENKDHIAEFFTKCDRPIWNAVKDKLKEFNDTSALRNIPIKCDNEECEKDYTAPLVFELSSFFG